MADENFQEDDFDVPEFNDEVPSEGLDEPAEFQQPAPQQQQPRLPVRPRVQQRRKAQPMTPQQAAAQAAPMQQPQMLPQQQAIQQAQPNQGPQARYIPYEIPKKIGLLDRTTGRPIIEDEDMLRVVMAQLADIKNDLEELKSQLYAV